MDVIALHRASGKSRVGNFNALRADFRLAFRENQPMVLLALVFLGGMAAGSLYAKGAGFETLQKLDFLFDGNFKARMTQSFLSVFAASFASAFIFLLACFLCGLSMWGAFLIPVVDVFRGFGLGLTAGYLYSTYAWKGFLYHLAVIAPGAFLCSLAILAASLEGIRCSRALAIHGSITKKGTAASRYFLRFGVLLAWACASALLDTILSALWGRLFVFA